MQISNVVKRGPGARVPRLAQAELEKVFGGPISMVPAQIADRPRLFHGKLAEHLWCGRCKRTFPNGTFRQVGEFRRCPYADCAGHASVDAMPWERVKASSADYPEIPAAGIRYPLVVIVVPVQGLTL